MSGHSLQPAATHTPDVVYIQAANFHTHMTLRLYIGTIHELFHCQQRSISVSKRSNDVRTRADINPRHQSTTAAAAARRHKGKPLNVASP